MESQVGFSDYDVFINFSGQDTRNIFVGHLYNALKGRGIRAFIDSKDLWKGEDIGKLLSLIKGVKLSVAVFSQRYVESEWCLKELAQMLECHKANRQIIFPIFFKVKTSDVKNQTGCFQISSQKHSEEEPETVSIWKDALRAAGDVSGWVFDDRDDQSELVEEVVQNAWIRLEKVPLIDAKHPVGLRSHVESVLSLLSNTSNSSSMDVQFLGICGPGGIGKTTIATAVYNCISENYTKSCFLEDVREQASQQNGKISLQKKLLYGISRVKTNICSSTEGSRLIKDRLQNVKTLLILDDVGDHIQLNWLARDLNWFGPKSRIIITTRDQSVLSGVLESNRKIYEPAELNREESLRLFSLYAFSTDQPPDDFMELSIDIVGTTGGLPLALEVLGSDLSMTKDEGDKLLWNSMIRMLKQIPHDAVFEKLKISFDNLHDIEKAMFLDVACLFVGWKVETVISIWEACGFAPRYRMEVLKRKSLLKIRQLDTWINHKEFWMHDQIRDMGRRIAYNQRPEDPYKHSRLWSRDNIMKVLNGCKGNEIVEALLLKFDVNDSTCLHTKDFEKMPELRLLQVDGATLWGSFQCLPSKLRWLSWQTCPLKKLPDNFYHEHLVILDLNGGFFGQAWNNWHGNKKFQQLKVLQLSNCRFLYKSPDFSGVPCLEKLYLNGCTSLINLHESIGELQQLFYLDLNYCKSLKKLPNCICKLSSLKILILTSCVSLKELPGSIGDLKESLVELFLELTNIETLPDGVGLLKKLENLNLCYNYQLTHLPGSMENMTSLRYLLLSGRAMLLCIPKLPSNIIHFGIRETQFESLPEMQNMKNLENLWLSEFFVKIEQFRGFVKTKNNDEFSELIGKMSRRSWVVTNRSRLTQVQQETFIWGNIESWRQIWIPLQQKTHEDDPRGRRYQFPDDDDDDDEIYRCRLIMHVTLGFYHYKPEEIPLEYVKRLSLEVDSRIHHKDERITDCRVGVAIEGIIKLNHLNHIDYIHEFEGFDWFGFQLEGKNAIDIAHDYKGFIENTDIEFTVRGVNLFLVKEGPMFDTHQFSTECHCYGRRFLEIIRYN